MRLFHRTSDRDEARDIISRTYGRNTIALRRRGAPLDFRIWWNEHTSLRIGYTRYGTDVRIDAPPIESWYVACFPTSGAIEVGGGATSARLTPARGAVLGPFEDLTFRGMSPGCTMLSIQINRGQLEDELAAMLGAPPRETIRFAFHFDVAGGVFSSALRLLHDVVSRGAEMPDDAGDGGEPAMVARFDRLVLTGLLLSQPHNYSAALRQPARPAPPERIRRVIDHIQAEPASVATATDLARIACLSLRALEDGFRRHVGVSPMRYLHDARLARARTLLAEADPGATSVTEIALRCGFAHLGRFAVDYRQKYGVRPSQTLGSGGPGASR